MEKNARLDVAKITQSANEFLGKKERNLYYLVIQTDKGKLTINVGEKTHNEVKALTEVVTKIIFDETEEQIKRNEQLIKDGNKLLNKTK